MSDFAWEAVLVHIAASVGVLVPMVLAALFVYWFMQRPGWGRAFTALGFLLFVWQIYHAGFIATEYWMDHQIATREGGAEAVDTWLTAANKLLENDQSEVLQLIVQGGVAGGFVAFMRQLSLRWQQSREFS